MTRLLRHTRVLSALVALFLASPSTWANMGGSELIAAAGNGNLDRVKVLLATKVDVNAKGDDGTTALVAGSQSGYEEVVRALLDAKADVNAKTSNGTTALMRAAQNGHVDVIKELIAAKADVNARETMASRS